MKTSTLFQTFLLALLMAAAGGGWNYAVCQEDSCHTLLIHSQVNHHAAPFDSLLFQNLTQNISQWFYYPDTVLSNCVLGIHSYPTTQPVIQVDVIGANPFSTHVFVGVFSSKNTKGKMRIVDMMGHVCREMDIVICEGTSQYKISIAKGGTYLLLVESEGCRAVQKLISLKATGSSESFDIEFIGTSEKEMTKETRDIAASISNGDHIRCYAFYTVSSNPIRIMKNIQINRYGDYHIVFDSFQNIGCDNFSLSNCELRIIDKNTNDYSTYPPHTYYHVLFSDSTFVSTPTEFSSESEAFSFTGEYKYRIEPFSEYEYKFYVCQINENLAEATNFLTVSLGDCDGFTIIRETAQTILLMDNVIIDRRF